MISNTREIDMASSISVGGLKVHESLYNLVRDEIAPGTGIDPDAFWTSLGELVRTLGPKNRQLLAKRDALQAKIDDWYCQREGKPVGADESEAFLREIGYLIPEGVDFQVTTAKIDPEIATIAGPQLVVP